MMRILTSLALFAALFTGTAYADAPEQLSSHEIGRYLRTLQVKPGMGPGPATPSGFTGDDSCRWANDGECDDPRYGTGACQQGTDYSDCWRIVAGTEDDSCRWANDGECDEPGFGTGACTQGTDISDCGDVVELRFRTDACDTAFNGVCEEPGIGSGRCAARSDRADCAGRDRPLTINDHFFGRDDRVFMDTAVFPWVVVGEIHLDRGSACTATLVGEDVLITASHCIHDNGQVSFAGRFETGFVLPGGPRTARIIDYFIDPDWDHVRFSGTDEIDNTDWALLRIDTPLGRELGFVGARGLVEESGNRAAMRADLYQAGYSWDTGAHLSGNERCHMTEIYADGTMAHDCDTTRGDSGSPFMVRDGSDWFIVATDSNFRRNPNGPFIYIAARSENWIEYLDDFRAGRLGRQSAVRGGVKPGVAAGPDPLIGK